MGKLRNAMYGTSDAPQNRGETANKQMIQLGPYGRELRPAVYWHQQRVITVVVHVDDFLCIGSADSLNWLFDSLRRSTT